MAQQENTVCGHTKREFQSKKTVSLEDPHLICLSLILSSVELFLHNEDCWFWSPSPVCSLYKGIASQSVGTGGINYLAVLDFKLPLFENEDRQEMWGKWERECMERCPGGIEPGAFWLHDIGLYHKAFPPLFCLWVGDLSFSIRSMDPNFCLDYELISFYCILLCSFFLFFHFVSIRLRGTDDVGQELPTVCHVNILFKWTWKNSNLFLNLCMVLHISCIACSVL